MGTTPIQEPNKEVIFLKTTLLRRVFPVLTLCALLLSASMPASAFLFGKDEAAGEAAVATFSKNGPASLPISFTPDDFRVEAGGNVALDSIQVDVLPDPAAGVLTLAEEPLAVGDVVAMNAVYGLRFTASAPGAPADSSFTFTPVFSNGAQGAQVVVGLHLLTAENSAPIAENLSLSTYKNVAITGQFAATDPEGDILTFQLVGKPARGAVALPEDGSARFVYTPYENKTGKDSFTYVAVDAVGNASAPATVKIVIEKASTKVTYADMDGVPSYKAAIRLAEEGVYVGECMGGQYFFQPDAQITRGEFVAMAMDACGVKALEGVQRTGFADDVSIPTWAKPYISSALKAGLVQGAQDESGQVVFNAASPISRAEASVLLDRLLQVTDVSTPTFYADTDSAPAWAYQSAVNLASCGVLAPDSTGALALDSTLTRGDAAELLCGALEMLDERDSGGWFNW